MAACGSHQGDFGVCWFEIPSLGVQGLRVLGPWNPENWEAWSSMQRPRKDCHCRGSDGDLTQLSLRVLSLVCRLVAKLA